MKLNQIALAVAATFVAAAASAAPTVHLGPTTSFDAQLWITGATAPTSSVYKGVRKLCVDDVDNADDSVAVPDGKPDDLTVFTEKYDPTKVADSFVPGKSAAGKMFAYACTMNSLAGSLAGLKTIVYHTADVGSFEAYIPELKLANDPNPAVSASSKRLKDVSTTTCTGGMAVNTVGDTSYAGCGSVAVPYVADTVLNALPTMSEGGFSDTEYALNKANLGIGTDLASIVADGDVSNERATNVGQGFGVALSWPLYYKMQVAQFGGTSSCVTGATGSLADPANLITPFVPVFTAACQPNISRQTYTAMANLGTVASQNGTSLGLPANTPVTLQRRVGTSGTQSSSNVYFLNKPCAGAAAGTPSGSNSVGSTTYGTTTVISNDGSSNVKTGLHNQSNAGTYGLGVLSLENKPTLSGASTEKFAFAKLDGVSPNFKADGSVNLQRESAIAGDYTFWYELAGFKGAHSTQEGRDLIDGIINTWSDASLVALTGVFPTALSGGAGVGVDVSKGYKTGNNCSLPVQD